MAYLPERFYDEVAFTLGIGAYVVISDLAFEPIDSHRGRSTVRNETMLHLHQFKTPRQLSIGFANADRFEYGAIKTATACWHEESLRWEPLLRQGWWVSCTIV